MTGLLWLAYAAGLWLFVGLIHIVAVITVFGAPPKGDRWTLLLLLVIWPATSRLSERALASMVREAMNIGWRKSRDNLMPVVETLAERSVHLNNAFERLRQAIASDRYSPEQLRELAEILASTYKTRTEAFHCYKPESDECQLVTDNLTALRGVPTILTTERIKIDDSVLLDADSGGESRA